MVLSKETSAVPTAFQRPESPYPQNDQAKSGLRIAPLAALEEPFISGLCL